ncbi:hypothetical protein FSP39_012697 [Pinctada imbricata]|uniref:PH domain-containing protein n=1 Tax=Pinctada imbricata TaxID=66713 RepID=A0AA89C3A3_PINIB|nr:hypothetical protein FSP39_012697 [Pinctada imbricata]
MIVFQNYILLDAAKDPKERKQWVKKIRDSINHQADLELKKILERSLTEFASPTSKVKPEPPDEVDHKDTQNKVVSQDTGGDNQGVMRKESTDQVQIPEHMLRMLQQMNLSGGGIPQTIKPIKTVIVPEKKSSIPEEIEEDKIQASEDDELKPKLQDFSRSITPLDVGLGSFRSDGTVPVTPIWEPPSMWETPNKALVAAIDFGTTFSGYAFSSENTFKADPLKMYTIQRWEGGGPIANLSFKTPTVLLLTPEGKFDSFGYAAENKYLSLVENETQKGWRYFKHFKMQLYKNRDVGRRMKLKDDQGGEMDAKDVFAMCIEFLKDSVYKTASSMNPDLQEDDIFWVLTVPAIWDDESRQFMRKAAFMAGISEKQLALALEPEAAAIYCKHLEFYRKTQGKEAVMAQFDPGTKFMVADLGGGTIDITVLEVTTSNSLRELKNASGGPYGGKCVDAEYAKFLREVFGTKVISVFEAENHEDYLTMIREFEVKKRKQDMKPNSFVTIELPVSLTEEAKKQSGKNMQETISSAPCKYITMGEIKYSAGKIRVQGTIMRELFKPSIDGTLKEINTLLNSDEMEDVSTILLVGGFSDCSYIQAAIREAFPNKKYICPNEGELCVVKGAVIFGHRTDIISTRLSRYHYGVAISEKWNPHKHPQDRVIKTEEGHVCPGVFSCIIKKGEQIDMGDTVFTYSFNPIENETLRTILSCTSQKARILQCL